MWINQWPQNLLRLLKATEATTSLEFSTGQVREAVHQKMPGLDLMLDAHKKHTVYVLYSWWIIPAKLSLKMHLLMLSENALTDF